MRLTQRRLTWAMLVMVGVALGWFVHLNAGCKAFTPDVDPRPYPCGNPQMHYCPVKVDGERTCCWDGEDCGGSPEFPGCPAGMCCNARGLQSKQVLDGGADAR